MKKVISAVLAGAMLATSVGVTTPALAEETAAPTASVQKSSVNAVYNQYLDVLQRYKTAQDNNFYRGQYDGPTLENMGLNPNVFFGSSARNLHYTLVDLANDGTPELFLADFNKNSSLPYWMIDLFGYENGSAKRIVNDRSLGYRSAYIITENGYLENQASGGARDSIYQYLTVKPNSATPVYSQSLEYVSWTGDEYYMNYGAFDYYNKYSISKSEFDNIRAQYPWKQNITWHPIDDYASLWSELNANTIPVFVDGVQIDFDQQPIIQDARTLVPLRGVFEALGATVYWNNDTRSVTAYKDGTTVELAIGSSTMYVNGQPKYLDVAGQIINDRTMVPLRAISEAFGAIVYWDNDTRTVRVYSDESTVPSDPDEPDADNPEINDPAEPENPDEEEPVDPEIPGTDEPTEPVDPEPPAEEPDNPVVEPENPEVDTPEEEQPSEEDQQKNVEYNAALLQLQSGYSYDAYYGFKALGDYKDSAELMNQAYWLNQLSYNASRLQYQELYDIRTNFELLSEDDIKKLMPTTIWLQPGMQSAGGAYYTFNADGTGTNPSSLNDPNPNPIETVWFVENGGLFHYTKDFVEHYEITTDGYLKEFRKIVDGVVADIDIVGHGISGPMPMNGSEIFVDFNSNIGKGLEKYWKRLEQAIYNISYQLDTNGIYYEVENQYN